MIQRLELKTHSRIEFLDITAKIRDAIANSGIKDGVCYIFVPHTTAGITINEHADPAVVEDIMAQLDVMAPQNKKYRHTEGNAPAHIKASLMGNVKTLFVENGKPVLGTWQGIFFTEFDGPRNRHVLVKIEADKD